MVDLLILASVSTKQIGLELSLIGYGLVLLDNKIDDNCHFQGGLYISR